MDWLDGILRWQRMERIEELEGDARRRRRTRKRRQRHARDLKQQLHELRLVSAALFELLMERAPVSNEELIARIEAIDLRDGVADGRLSKRDDRRRCPACRRLLLQSLPHCLYCGPAEETDEEASSM